MGRDPIILRDFEPLSETQLDDMSAGIPGTSRHHMRVREISVQSIVQQTAIQRLERALGSKTRLAVEQLDLKPGDLSDFWRKPANKDESGWRGPATVVEVGLPLTIRWHNRHLNVKLQDVRRSLVYLVLLEYGFRADEDKDDPFHIVVTFADSVISFSVVTFSGSVVTFACGEDAQDEEGLSSEDFF